MVSTLYVKKGTNTTDVVLHNPSTTNTEAPQISCGEIAHDAPLFILFSISLMLAVLTP